MEISIGFAYLDKQGVETWKRFVTLNDHGYMDKEKYIKMVFDLKIHIDLTFGVSSDVVTEWGEILNPVTLRERLS